jgi:Rieske Fe-S protein
LPSGVTVAGNVVTVALAQQPQLQTRGGILMINSTSPQVNVLVLGLGGGAYNAFTSRCTHEGTNNAWAWLPNGNLTCNAHGSVFSDQGTVVAGPAAQALARFAVAVNSAAGTIAITVS